MKHTITLLYLVAFNFSLALGMEQSVDPRQLIYQKYFSASEEQKKASSSSSHSSIFSVNLDPNGQEAVTGCFDGTLKIYDTNTQILKGLITLPADQDAALFSVQFVDDKQLASINPDGKIIFLWNREGNASAGELKEEGKWVARGGLVADPTGRWMASGGEEGLYFWDLHNKKKIALFTTANDNKTTQVAISNDAKYMAQGTLDGTIRVWALDNPTKPLYEAMVQKRFYTSALAFNNEGTSLVAGGVVLPENTTGSVFVCPIEKGSPVVKLGEHTQQVMAANFNQEGNEVYSGSIDKTIKLWNVQDKKCLLTQKMPESPYGFGLLALNTLAGYYCVGNMSGNLCIGTLDKANLTEDQTVTEPKTHQGSYCICS